MDLVKVWNKIWSYVFAGIISIPHILLACYSIPGVDDYSCLNAVSSLREKYGYFIAALIYVKDTYFTWQGTYTGELIMGLEPSVRQSFFLLRLILILSVVLFAAGTLFFAFTIANKLFGLSRNCSWIIALLAEFIAFNISSSGELFSWYTGAAVYTFPLIAYLFALSFSILSYYEGKKKYFILAAILGFIGSGGSLMVVGFGCGAFGVLVITYFYNIGYKKNCTKRYLSLIAPFIVTLLGALICVAAPGNYIRQGGSMHIFESIFYSGANIINRTLVMLRMYLLPICFLISFIIGLTKIRKVITKEKVLFGLFGFCFVTFLTAFPVILGYDKYCFEAYSNSDRVIYFADYIICFIFLILGLLLGAFVRSVMNSYSIDIKKELLKIAPVVLIILLFFSKSFVTAFNNGMTMKICDDFIEKRIQIVSSVYTDIYKEIASYGENTDVYISRQVNPFTVLYSPGYALDSDYFGNIEVANYYNVNSFSMNWLEY